MTKDLQEKAINIKGKQYVLVSDRILYFNETYPNGTIETQLVSDPGADMVIIRACVTPDIDKETRFFTGYSQAIKGQGLVNTTAALENAETSAVGRALAMMGIGVIDSVASVDEMNKAGASVTTTVNTQNTTLREQPEASEDGERKHFCTEHNKPYGKMTKGDKSWYSHPIEGGGWCNER